MGDKLHPERASGAEVARVIQEEITLLLGGIMDRTVGVEERARRARVSCKKIRASLRLVAPGNPKLCSWGDRAFRDAARKLAALREAGVAVETLEALRQQWGDKVDRRCFAAARRALGAARRGPGPTPAETEQRFRQVEKKVRMAGARLGEWAIAGEGFDVLAEGFEDGYRTARRAFRRARERSSTEAFHTWRKRAKIHGHHARLLRGAWPVIMKKWTRSLKLLAKLLGDEHDLALLREEILTQAGGGEPKESIGGLVELIEVRRAELRDEAVTLGRRLFAEKPGAMVRRVAIWWSTAQENGAAEPEEPSLHKTVW